MFYGMQNAVHYLDHFAFLHEVMFNIQGAMTSYYQFYTNEEFSLAFDLKQFGVMKEADDGFMVLLSTQPFKPDYIVPSDNKTAAGFENRLGKVDTAGFYFYFTGSEKGKVYVGHSETTLDFSKATAGTCSFDWSETPRFFIRLAKGVLYLSKGNLKNGDYEVCWQKKLEAPWMISFYLSMFARSSPLSSFRIDVKSIIFSTDLENLGISEFEAKYDDNDHKLFRQIHFFQVNKNETEHYFKQAVPETDLKSLNLSTIHDYQNQIYNAFDYSNVLLEKNLESTDDIVMYLGQQKMAVETYSVGLLESMRKWVNESKSQFELIEKDTLDIVSEFKSFDLEAEFTITQNLLDILKKKFLAHADKMKNLKNFGSQIKKNLDYLKSKKSQLKGLPDQIRNYLSAIEEHSNASADTFILTLLVGAGMFVTLALVAILCRLSKGQNVASLGGI